MSDDNRRAASGGSGGASSIPGGLPMGPGGVTGRVLVRELADYITYHGRRARFGDITGTIHGLTTTTGVGLTTEGQTVSRAGANELVLIDDLGVTHHLAFGVHDFVTLLD